MSFSKWAPAFAAIFSFAIIGCSSTPKLDTNLVRPWKSELENEFPQQRPALIHYKKGPYELFYLAARHENSTNGDTLSLVSYLFDNFKFDVLVIEPFAFSYGKSPSFYIEESNKGLNEDFIKGGESAWAVIQANKRKIPFYGGEPDHKDIYNELKKEGFTDKDFLGFYLVRQIPQWIREKEKPQGAIERRGSEFINFYCKTITIKPCPSLDELKQWYQEKAGRKLTPQVSNEETAPYDNTPLFTQKISAQIGKIRNKYTLERLQELLTQYKKIAVVYGASHYVVLRKSFDEAFGQPAILK